MKYEITKVVLAAEADEAAVIAAVEASVAEYAEAEAARAVHPLSSLVGRKGQVDDHPQRR